VAVADDAVVPARDALVPARVVAAAKRRKELAAQLAADLRQIKQAKADIAQAKVLIAKKTVEVATKAGKEVGRASMKAGLERIPATVPPGTKLPVNGEQLKAIMLSALQQLRDKKYYLTVHTQEFGQAFADAFVLGVHEAVAEFESTPRQYSPRQAIDA